MSAVPERWCTSENGILAPKETNDFDLQFVSLLNHNEKKSKSSFLPFDPKFPFLFTLYDYLKS